MGREVRKVPPDWQHPKDEKGYFIPMFSYNDWEIRVACYAESVKAGEDPGEFPHSKDYMPDWLPEEATHYQLYETVTEGTPISPVMKSPEALARWLTDNKISAFASFTATYEQWLKVCKGQPRVSVVITRNGKLISGVELESGRE